MLACWEPLPISIWQGACVLRYWGYCPLWELWPPVSSLRFAKNTEVLLLCITGNRFRLLIIWVIINSCPPPPLDCTLLVRRTVSARDPGLTEHVSDQRLCGHSWWALLGNSFIYRHVFFCFLKIGIPVVSNVIAKGLSSLNQRIKRNTLTNFNVKAKCLPPGVRLRISIL